MKKRDSNEDNVLHTECHPCEGSELIITRNLLAIVGIHNSAKGEAVHFIYKYESGQRNRNPPEAVVINCFELDDDFEPFIT